MKRISFALIFLLIMALSAAGFAEDKMLMPNLNDANLQLHQKRSLAGYCDKEKQSQPVYIEFYQDEASKELTAYFKSETAEKPSVIVVQTESSVVIYADFNGDGVVDVSGAPDDSKIGKGPCDTIYNLRS